MSARNLNNFDTTVQSWYTLFRSREIKRGKIKAAHVLNRKIAVFRDVSGKVHAIDARCPHMGADLSIGKVCGSCIQCPLHKWQISHEGKVVSAPYEPEVPERRVRAYPTKEQYGYIWIFNGPEPFFGTPEIDLGRYCAIPMPSQIFNQHPHFLTANGLDWRHLDTLHEMQFSRSSTWCKDGEYGVIVEHCGKPKSRFLQFITGTYWKNILGSFQTLGPNTALITVTQPGEFYLLFSSTPLNNRTSRTRAIVFLPRANPIQFVKSFAMYLFVTLFVLLYKDHKIFNSTDFLPGFTDVDEPFKMYAEIVDRLPRF